MPALVLVTALAMWGLIEQGALGAEWLPMLKAGRHHGRSANLPASDLDPGLLVFLPDRTLFHLVAGDTRRAELDQPRPALQCLAAVLVAPADEAGLFPRQTRRDCRPGGRGGRVAGGGRISAGGLLQSRSDRGPRYLAPAAGRHPVRPDDRRLGGDLDAGLVVDVAAVAVCRPRVGRAVPYRLGGRRRARHDSPRDPCL